MNPRVIAIVLLIPFSILSAYAVYQVGYIGIFDYQRHSPAGWQVIIDLIIACILLLMWLISDAKAKAVNPLPYVVITVFLGSFGPLIYLLIHGSGAPQSNSRTI